MNIKPKIVSLALAGTLALSTCPFASATNINNFTDVKPSDWYYSAVGHVVERNYFNGITANTFAPNASMNRAMAVTVLARMFTDNLDSYSGKTAFTDVPTDAYYAKAVQWAVQKGITNGTSAITFSPNNAVTREQISTFLYNAVKATGKLSDFDASVFDTFGDKGDVASWAADALKWATSKGIIGGSNGKLLPKNSTTRAAFATIAMNYDSKYQGSGSTPTPAPNPDPTPNPVPDPTPSEDAFVTSKEDEINALLVASWGTSGAPQRNTDKLVQAARVIASGKIKDAEEALKSVGFDKPMGTIYRDKYTYDRYDVKSYLVTTSSVTQAANNLKNQEGLMKTGTFTEYGVGVYKMNDIQFRVVVVTYRGTPYSASNTVQMEDDWLAQQAATPVTLSALEQQVFDLTNQERIKNGLPPYKMAAEMQEAARIRVNELPIYMDSSHGRPNGSMFFTVFHDINSALAYRLNGELTVCGKTGENFGWGQTTPEEVVNDWMNSKGHRRNILDANHEYLGVAAIPRYVDGVQQGYYWEQIFLGMDR